MYIYIYIYPPFSIHHLCKPAIGSRRRVRLRLSLCKILFRFKALVWQSIILLLPPPLVKPTLLQYYCTTIAQYPPSYRHPFCMPDTKQYW